MGCGTARWGGSSGKTQRRRLLENVLCVPFLFLQNLGTFLRSELLWTAVQVWAEV